ncbi:MAG TPA: ABC transporter permease [Gaiellaceae bacterium]|nr:ABC transporter permease [Gaiellaceae bacterium]
MLVFALKRLLWAIPVLLVCVTLLFGLMRAIGGSPLRHGPPLGLSNEAWVKYSDPKPDEITRNMQRRLGLDAPWYVQYERYVSRLARLDFGPTTSFPGRSVNGILREQGPVTAQLVGLALIWIAVLGPGLGIGAAVWRGSLFDRATTAATALMTAVPLLLIATLLIWLVSVKLTLLPTSGWHGWRTWVLPSLALALLPVAQIARVLRSRCSRSASASSCSPLAPRAYAAAGWSAFTCCGRRPCPCSRWRPGPAARAARARPVHRRVDLRDPRDRPVLHRRSAGA